MDLSLTPDKNSPYPRFSAHSKSLLALLSPSPSVYTYIHVMKYYNLAV